MKKIYVFIWMMFVFLLLTITTQIGGLVYLFSKIFATRWKPRFLFKLPLIFIVLYYLSSSLLVPRLAMEWGRIKIETNDQLKPGSIITNILNRNYVKPELNTVLQKTAKELKTEGIRLHYLDANFPFFDGFPLWPHLSHHDGKKVDLSFVYTNEQGKISRLLKSNSGYGVFEAPQKGETNQTEDCLNRGFKQYELAKYLTLGKKNKLLVFSEKHTKSLLQKILKNKTVQKIFIEPHLKQRLKIKDERIRYHGCKAVRHDDHIHLQIK